MPPSAVEIRVVSPPQLDDAEFRRATIDQHSLAYALRTITGPPCGGNLLVLISQANRNGLATQVGGLLGNHLANTLI